LAEREAKRAKLIVAAQTKQTKRTKRGALKNLPDDDELEAMAAVLDPLTISDHVGTLFQRCDSGATCVLSQLALPNVLVFAMCDMLRVRDLVTGVARVNRAGYAAVVAYGRYIHAEHQLPEHIINTASEGDATATATAALEVRTEEYICNVQRRTPC